jgi:hypothetical protein
MFGTLLGPPVHVTAAWIGQQSDGHQLLHVDACGPSTSSIYIAIHLF